MPASPITSVDNVSPWASHDQWYTHSVEPELTGSLPRRAQFTRWTVTKRVAFWLLMVCFLGGMAYLSQRDAKNADALLKQGKTAKATVTGKYTTTNNNGNQNNGPEYILNFAFRTADGFTRSGTRQVDHATYDKAKKGDPATVVTYLPSSHGEIWEDGIVTAQGNLWRQRTWGIVTLGTVVPLCLLMAIGEWQWKRQLQMLQNGIAVVGQVTQGKVTRGPKGQTYYHLTYQYPVGSGMNQQTVRVGKKLYQDHTQGNPFLTVLYDPQTPAASRPYGLLRAGQVVP